MEAHDCGCAIVGVEVGSADMQQHFTHSAEAAVHDLDFLTRLLSWSTWP